MKQVGVLTSGGDSPGMNSAIRAVVHEAVEKGLKVFGFSRGYNGLIDNEGTELDLKAVGGLLQRGGTMLLSARSDEFRTPEGRKTACQSLGKRKIDALVVIGGDGTLKIALELFRRGAQVVGVPKTIDNDLSATEITFGFDTAIHTVTDAIDKIHTTAESHHRVMLVEVMGRDAGWIALHSGIAGGADVILLPEIPFSLEKICAKIRQRADAGRHFSIIVVAEGCRTIDGRPLLDEIAEERRRTPRGGAIANTIGELIAHHTRRETRVTVLGHIQRGGSPSPFDRILGSRLGVAAVDLVARGEFGRMVCLRGASIQSTTLEEAVGVLKTVSPDGELVKAATALGISFGN